MKNNISSTLYPNFCVELSGKLGIISIAVVAIIILSGCAGTTSSIIAATGTTIGVELSQNQATQTPIGVLGYKRAELAYVPTNRSTATKTTTTKEENGKTMIIE
jgi:hypothetical protein